MNRNITDKVRMDEDIIELFRQGRFREIIRILGDIVSQKGSIDLDLMFLLSVAHYKIKEFDHALFYLKRIENIAPLNKEANYLLALIYEDRNEKEKAIKCYERILLVEPDNDTAHLALAHLYQTLGDTEKAIDHLERYLSIHPNNSNELNTLGTLYLSVGKFDDALDYYNRSIEINPAMALARFNRALIYLLQGDYERGWSEYEWRWKTDVIKSSIFPYKRKIDSPVWSGEDLRGKRILVHDEQGFGDTIQFIRYVPELAKMDAEVLVQCQDALMRLINTISGVTKVLGHTDAPEECDYQITTLGLPLRFRTSLDSIPVNIPYFHLKREDVIDIRERLKISDRFVNVGIVWAGRAQHNFDRYRSLGFNDLDFLSNYNRIKLYSLQMDKAKEDIKGNKKIIDCSILIKDFYDTALIIENLDLVITVDTAVAHLAGALGKPVWILLSYVPDWRWLLNRRDSPWYPTATLFRQSRLGSWTEPLRELRMEIENFLERPHSFKANILHC